MDPRIQVALGSTKVLWMNSEPRMDTATKIREMPFDSFGSLGVKGGEMAGRFDSSKMFLHPFFFGGKSCIMPAIIEGIILYHQPKKYRCVSLTLRFPPQKMDSKSGF